MVVQAAALAVPAALQRQQEMETLLLHRQAKEITAVITVATLDRLTPQAAVVVLVLLAATELHRLLEVAAMVLHR